MNEFQTPTRNHKKDKRTQSMFKKYKSLLDQSKQSVKDQAIDKLFQNFNFSPLSMNSAQKRCNYLNQQIVSTIQSISINSQLDESLQCNENNSFLSSQLVIFSALDLNQEPVLEANGDKPAYIKQFNKLSSITPNFHHPLFDMKQQIKNLTNHIKVAMQAINHVLNCAQKVQMMQKCLKVFAADCLQILTVDFFMTFGWDKAKNDQAFNALRPKQNFYQVVKPHQIIEILNNLLLKATRYELAASLTQQMGLQLYKNIRQNLCQIEQKLLECSNSTYKIWNKHEYPLFYYKYLQILRGNFSKSPTQLQLIIKKFRQLWQMHEPVTCSEVGQQVWQRLHSVI